MYTIILSYEPRLSSPPYKYKAKLREPRAVCACDLSRLGRAWRRLRLGRGHEDGEGHFVLVACRLADLGRGRLLMEAARCVVIMENVSWISGTMHGGVEAHA